MSGICQCQNHDKGLHSEKACLMNSRNKSHCFICSDFKTRLLFLPEKQLASPEMESSAVYCEMWSTVNKVISNKDFVTYSTENPECEMGEKICNVVKLIIT